MDNMLYINYDVIKGGASWKVHIKKEGNLPFI